MTSWLSQTFQPDEEGYVSDMVGSQLAGALDSEAVYCPASIMIKSQTASTNIPGRNLSTKTGATLSMKLDTNTIKSNAFDNIYNDNDNDSRIGEFKYYTDYSIDNINANEISAVETTDKYNNSITTNNITWNEKSTSIANRIIDSMKPPSINDAVSRLNVLWLRRKAELEKSSGKSHEAYKTLQGAIDLHLGTREYEKADLADPVLSSNPHELLENISNNYMVYDKFAFRMSYVIAHWYRNRHKRRCKMQTKITSLWRAFKVRRALWIWRERRRQNATIIQRRFRFHLIKMKKYARKIINWLQCINQMRDFQFVMQRYRAARRIQALHRGNKGRQIAAKKRFYYNCVLRTQRNARGYMKRNDRAFGVILFHKLFYVKARVLQCFFRCQLAIRHSHKKLINELIREQVRMSHETQLVDQTIKVEIDRLRLYMKTDGGRLHLSMIKRRLHLKDNYFKSIKHTLSKEEILTHEALVTFEMFDTDGSGQIDESELSFMLKELGIPMSHSQVTELAESIDSDGSGDIDFGEFVNWYILIGAEGDKNASISKRLIATALKARHAIMEISGQILQMRAEREVLRECTTWKTKDIISTFRVNRPPKFQCCRCLQPFVLYTDYNFHFDKDGLCKVTNEKALYFREYKDWSLQRQLEYEILRVHDESPCVGYSQSLSLYADLALLKDFSVAALVKKHSRVAKKMFIEKLTSESGLDRTLGEMIMDIMDMCKEGFITPIIGEIVSDILSRPLPEKWFLLDAWDIQEFQEWLKVNVDEGIAIKKPCYYFTDNMKMSLDAYLLAEVYVKCVRTLQVGAESSLVALLEFRHRRPRRMKMSDDELKKLGMENLTEESYIKVKDDISNKLKILKDAMYKLYTIQIPGCCGRGNMAFKYVQIEPDGSLSPETLDKIMFHEAQIFAYAKYWSRLKTSIGGVQQQRLANELWAKRRLLIEQMQESDPNDGYNNAILKFQFDKYALLGTDDGVDAWDFDQLQKMLAIKVREQRVDEVLKILDPKNRGYIHFSHFNEWVNSNSHRKYDSLLRFLGNQISNGFYFLLHMTYKRHAQDRIYTNIRSIYRLELRLRNLSIKSILQIEEAVAAGAVGEELEAIKTKFKNELEDNQKILEDVRTADNLGEVMLITRMIMDEAERKIRSTFWSRDGRYKLRTEMYIIQLVDVMVEAYGYCIKPGSTSPWVHSWMQILSGNKETNETHELGWDLAFEMLVHAFDTDCSGSFDEGEVRLLLQCVKYPLPDNKMLYNFPELLDGDSSAERMVQFLAPRVTFYRGIFGPFGSNGKLSVSRKNSLLASSMMLISLARQYARSRTEEATELFRSGKLLEDDDGVKTDNALMVRSQLFAMRQVHLYFKTTLGKNHVGNILAKVRLWWKEHVVSRKYDITGLFTYAFYIHSEWNGILITELPHVVKFLITRLNFKPNSEISIIAELCNKIRAKEDLYWLSLEDILELLSPLFTVNTSPLYRKVTLMGNSLKKDTKFNMLSRARQEAVLIAMRTEEIYVADTNYRCSVLGLEEVLSLPEPYKKRDIKIDWYNVPKEMTWLLLKSKGYLSKDCRLPEMKEWVCTDHPTGTFAMESVDILEVCKHAKVTASNNLMFPQKILRGLLWWKGISNYLEYRKITRTLVLQSEEINEHGALFLEELLTGQSHLIDNDEV